MSLISENKKRQTKQLLDTNNEDSILEDIDRSNDHSLYKTEFHFGKYSGPALLKLYCLFLQEKKEMRPCRAYKYYNSHGVWFNVWCVP